MTSVQFWSLFWCAIFAAMAIGVLLATIRMGLDEQAEREKRDQPQDEEQ